MSDKSTLDRKSTLLTVMVSNYLLQRQAFMSRFMRRAMDDPRRAIDDECGYPSVITLPMYKEMYDRELGSRVVGVYPEETWSVYPDHYETPDPKQTTAYEERFNQVNFEHDLWKVCHDADEQAGIGNFSIVVIGLNDGRTLDQPADGLDPVTGQPWDVRQPRDITFLQVYPHTAVRIAEYEKDERSPRFGMPTMYEIETQTGLTNVTTTTEGYSPAAGQHRKVHWTRVHHQIDNAKGNKVFHVPRQQDVFNRLLDLRKVLGAAGEGFWRGGIPLYSAEALPEFVLEGELNEKTIKDQFEKMFSGAQRYGAFQGFSLKNLAPAVVDPNPHITSNIQIICALKGVPYPIFMGQDTGVLASAQNSQNWNRRLNRRQNLEITPNTINPLSRRLQYLGVLPVIKKWYTDWKDMNALSDLDRAAVAMKNTQALLQYVTGGVEVILPPLQFLTEIMGFSLNQAEIIMTAIEKNQTFLTEKFWKNQQTSKNPGTKAGQNPANQLGNTGQGNPPGA